MVVVCETPDCPNNGYDIDITPPAPDDRDGWVIVCGVCGHPIPIPEPAP